MTKTRPTVGLHYRTKNGDEAVITDYTRYTVTVKRVRDGRMFIIPRVDWEFFAEHGEFLFSDTRKISEL